MSKLCEIHGPQQVNFVDSYQNFRRLDCPWCQIDRLYSVLCQIERIGPLGVDTYPEVYRRIQEVVSAELIREPKGKK